MSETRRISKDGFSKKFFNELNKEHENIDELAKRQKELKQKHNQKTDD